MKRNNRLKLAALLLALSILINLDTNAIKNNYVYYFTDYKQTLAELGSQFDINFAYDVTNEFLDMDVFDAALENKAQRMSDFELSRYSVLLPYFFSKYPENIIKNELKTVKLAGSLVLYSTPYGGTSFDSTLYLTSRGKNKGYTDEYIERLFHHEFSSTLMRNHNFPSDVWAASNLPDFKYAQNEEEILKAVADSASHSSSIALYTKGFLTKYAMSTLENDMNIMAEEVFTTPEHLKKIIHQYPIIMKKYKILKDFYLKIDPKFKAIFDAVD